MYSKSPSRSNRSKGIKVKHILQVCLLVAVCFWLIYQVKHSHEKKKEFDEKDAKLVSDTQSDGEVLRLGRKDISRVADDKSNGEDDEENEADQAENRHENDEEERESRTEDREEEEDTGRGGEDDEIDKSEEEKSDDENHEESVDEEKDREETDEKNEDNDDGEKEDNEESETVVEDRDHEGAARNTHEAREEHYKADDASSEVAQDTRSIILDAENATLKHTNGSSELIIDGKENVSQSSNQPLLEEKSHEQIESSNSSDSRVSESMEHKANLTVSEDGSSENRTALTESSDQSQVRNNSIQLDSLQSPNTTQAHNATYEDVHNEGSNPTLSLFSHANTSDSSSEKSQLDSKTIVNSTELANPTSEESLGSSTEVKLDAENITNATEKKADDVSSANAGTDENPGSNSENNVTGGESESSISDTAKDNAGADDVHDNVDDFASSLTQEEKEYRTDPGTLPDIKVEVQNSDDIEAE